ncbi:pseudocobalamin biosynthesis CobD domain protein [Synechococcus sp. ROS8604]|nr:pseudocobalamin biosynthesis CobD domain protein [Synechococcus sp. ROS8604]
MGAVIQQHRLGVKAILGERPWALRIGGGLITTVAVVGSALAG